MRSKMPLGLVVIAELTVSLVLLSVLVFLLWRFGAFRSEPSRKPAAAAATPLAAGTPESSPTAGHAVTNPPPTVAPTKTPVQVTAPLLPTASPAAAPTPTPTYQMVASRVSAGGDGLRLRESPSLDGAVMTMLTAGSPLAVFGRTADSVWLRVVVPSGETGWVMAQYVDVGVPLEQIPVLAPGEAAAPSASSQITALALANASQVFLAGQSLGNRPNAFSLVGDSNTDNPAFFALFDQGQYNLGPYTDMQATVDYFQGSFGRQSAAAVGSFSAAKVLDPAYADDPCQDGESPLECEYRQWQPAIALILLGTGDQHDWANFEGRYRQIIDMTLQRGIIPVLFTKADDLEYLEGGAPPGYINAIIRRLAGEYQAPLVDLYGAVDSLPARGCQTDGFHLNAPPDGRAADFTLDHLPYGQTQHNFLALQALDVLRQQVIR
jgi:hypothetical protein